MKVSLRAMLLAVAMTAPACLSATADEGIAIQFIGGLAYDATATQTSYNNSEVLLNGGCAAPTGCAAAAPTCGVDPACGADPACGCDDACDDCCDFGPFLACKRWNIQAGAPLMVRNNVPEGIITDDDGDKEIGPASGFYAGFQLNAIKYRDNCRDIEFGIMTMGNGGPLRANGFGPDAVLEPGLPIGSGVAITSYKSDVLSLEANLRLRRSDRFSWIVGARYINLNETLLANTVSSGPPFFAIGAITTKNNLFGGQFGAGAILAQSCRWTVNGVVRGGIYYNDCENTIAALSLFGPFLSQEDRNPIAYEADAQLMATYWMTDHFGFRFGYQVMVLDRVAVVPSQLTSLRGSGIDTNATPFWHGALVQAEVIW